MTLNKKETWLVIDRYGEVLGTYRVKASAIQYKNSYPGYYGAKVVMNKNEDKNKKEKN
jgi:hypothetical protein